MKKTLYMETTKIAAERTVAEIQCTLGEYGATAILTDYLRGEVSAVSFKIDVSGQEVPFRLPCRWENICEVLRARRKRRNRRSEDESIQAKRVAWRQILRWIQAQMALVETNMVKIEEVFLPYMQSKNGQTLYQVISDRGFRMLEDKRERKSS